MWPKWQMLSSNLQILTRLSHPPETKRLIGGCRAPWSKRALGAVEGAQLTALQPIWKQPITDVVTLHQSQTFMHFSVALSLPQTPPHCTSHPSTANHRCCYTPSTTSTIALQFCTLQTAYHKHHHTAHHTSQQPLTHAVTLHQHRCITVLHSVC